MAPGDTLRLLLGQNIKQLRSNRQMSQAELAEEAEISVPFMSEIERGHKWPQPDNLAKIALALDVEVYDLFKPENPAAFEVKEIISELVENIIGLANKSTERLNRIIGQRNPSG